MKYMGSKRLLAKKLAPVIEGMLDLGKCRDYVEPFVGGCNMIDKIKAEGVRRHGYDNNRYLIAMLSCLDAVEKEMPDEMPREEYEAVRADYNAGGGAYADWYTGAVGFLASRSGRFFDGGFSGIFTDKDGKTRNYYLEAKRNVLAQAPLLKDVEFGFGDYRETCSKYGGAVIYCDPPYKGTKQYNTSRNFDYEAFWDWCRMMADKNIVLVSEQTAPGEPWIETVWEQDVKRAINHSETKEATEKLFLVRGEFYDKCLDSARDSLWTNHKVPKGKPVPEQAEAHPNTAADYGMPEVRLTRNRPVSLEAAPPVFSFNAADELINTALSKLPPESFPRKYCISPFAVTDREGKNRYCWQIEGGCGSCEVVLRLGESCAGPKPDAPVCTDMERTNWDMHREKILERCAQGMCFDCLARRTCERLCRERNIDVTLTKPPCAEAWHVWATEPCNGGKKDV